MMKMAQLLEALLQTMTSIHMRGFDMVKAAYTRKRRGCRTKRGRGPCLHLEKAYNKLMAQFFKSGSWRDRYSGGIPFYQGC
ncbi:hypothetical protein M8C21_010314 [Ambrosia artemisiifolia]|uniref:Uncharacterized protein n=1 Tax=Ambrosia artemisiifolia TaxID=4212 RepID=A0AAD5BZX4_AMBAR|nr:hypothetical protein M8C21_010314 [Ambrosia artemisiifolia]